jgi:hypothetical protein
MLLHIFGSIFGLMMSRVFNQEGFKQQLEKEKMVSKVDVLSLIGMYIAKC